jgi:hypothetical protein
MPDRGKWPLAALIACVAVLATPAASSAVTVTLGRTDLSAMPLEYFECPNCQNTAALDRTAGTGTLLRVPADGTVTGWRAVGRAVGAALRLVVLRPNADDTFAAKTFSSDGGFDGTLNPTAQAITAGDMVGIYLINESPFNMGDHAGIGFAAAPGESWSELNFPSQGQGLAGSPVLGQDLLYNATVELLPPGLSAISPNSGGGGTVVTITGQHLAVATGVTFGGVPASAFSGDDERLTAVAPPRIAGGPVDVQVTTAGGMTPAVPADLFTYPATPSPPLLLADHTPPTVSSLALAPTSFRAAKTGASILASRVGTRVSHRLSEPSTMTFTVQRVRAGRRSGKRCVAPSRANRGKRRCTRLKAVPGSFTRAGIAGSNSFTFTGRMGGKTLSRGSYRLVAIARDAAGNRSKPVARAFSIVR